MARDNPLENRTGSPERSMSAPSYTRAIGGSPFLLVVELGSPRAPRAHHDLHSGTVAPPFGVRIWTGDSHLWVLSEHLLPIRDKVVTALPADMTTSRDCRLALLGHCDASTGSFEQTAHRALRSGDYSYLPSMGGSYNLVVERNGVVSVSTDVAGLRPVYYTRFEETIICSSSALLLARLAGPTLSVPWLAARLMLPQMPTTTATLSPFKNVARVPEGHWFMPEDQSYERYWYPPTQFTPGASVQLQEALTKAVGGHVDDSLGDVSCDSSGGFDSTTISYLASRSATGTKHCTLWTYSDPEDTTATDHRYAAAARSMLATTSSMEVSLRDFPPLYHDIFSAPVTDEPTPLSLAFGRLGEQTDALAGRQSYVHLTGHGADAVVTSAHSSYVADLIHAGEYRAALRHAQAATAASSQWSARRFMLAAATVAKTSYSNWLFSMAEQLRTSTPSSSTSEGPYVGWAGPVDYLPWFTSDCRQLAADCLTEDSSRDSAYAPLPGQNHAISAIIDSGRTCRMFQQAADRSTPQYAFPFLDERVIHAGLTADYEARSSLFSLKPLMREAFSDMLPSIILQRSRKSTYNHYAYDCVTQNAGTLRSLMDDSILVKEHLIDAARFSAGIEACARRVGGALRGLNCTIAVEVWLRQIATSAALEQWSPDRS